MGLQLAIFSKPDGGELLLDATPFITSCKASTNEHGVEAINVTVDRTLYDAFRIYNAPGALHVVLSNGGGPIAVGRLEEPGLSVGGKNELSLNALGYWRALSDLPYTALWSSTDLSAWTPVEDAVIATQSTAKYQIETDNALKIMPRKGEAFGTSIPVYGGAILFRAPNGGSRQIVAVQFSYELIAPSGGWLAVLERRNSGLGYVANAWSLAATGSTQRGAQAITLTACDALTFTLYYNAAGPVTYSGETGNAYLKITNLRVYTTTTNRNATGISAIGATPGSASVTPVSMATIYVGQKVYISSASGGEIVTVTAVTSTTFTATFTQAHSTSDTVVAHAVYADEVIRDLVSTINATNSTQLQSSTALIQSPGRDVPDCVYEDADMGELATDLATKGRQASAAYEVGVDLQRRLVFRPRGNQARTWYIDVEDLSITRALDGMRNSVYAIYQDASGTTVRSAVAVDSTSVQRYGLTRRKGVSVQSADATYAASVRDAALVDDALVEPRASYTLSQVFGVNGALVPLWFVVAGDYLVLRNLPPAVSSSLDTVHMFRLTRTEYDPLSETLTIEPEAPLPTLDALIAQQG